MEDDSSKKEKPPGPQLVQKEATRKSRKRLTPDDKLNNFCKAMAEQELFEAGAFPNARDAGDVREEMGKKWSGRLLTRKPRDGAGRLPWRASLSDRFTSSSQVPFPQVLFPVSAALPVCSALALSVEVIFPATR